MGQENAIVAGLQERPAAFLVILDLAGRDPSEHSDGPGNRQSTDAAAGQPASLRGSWVLARCSRGYQRAPTPSGRVFLWRVLTSG